MSSRFPDLRRDRFMKTAPLASTVYWCIPPDTMTVYTHTYVQQFLQPSMCTLARLTLHRRTTQSSNLTRCVNTFASQTPRMTVTHAITSLLFSARRCYSVGLPLHTSAPVCLRGQRLPMFALRVICLVLAQYMTVSSVYVTIAVSFEL